MPAASQWFQTMLRRVVERPLWALVGTIALPIVGFVLSGQLGNVFFPSADRDQFEIYLWMPSGTAIDRTSSVVAEVDNAIRSKETVTQVD